jgi:AcrR family transcriptional regulator
VATAPARRRLSKDARRAELLRAGERVFSERPYEAVSIEDIADAAGISKNLLYHYFAGKRDLYLTTIREAAEQMLAATEPDLDLPPMERLAGSIEAHLRYASEHARGYTSLLRGAGGDPEVAAIVAATQEAAARRALSQLPIPGGPPPELELAIRGWIGFIDALTLRWLDQGGLSLERLRDMLVDEFVAVVTAAATAASR